MNYGKKNRCELKRVIIIHFKSLHSAFHSYSATRYHFFVAGERVQENIWILQMRDFFFAFFHFLGQLKTERNASCIRSAEIMGEKVCHIVKLDIVAEIAASMKGELWQQTVEKYQ